MIIFGTKILMLVFLAGCGQGSTPVRDVDDSYYYYYDEYGESNNNETSSTTAQPLNNVVRSAVTDTSGKRKSEFRARPSCTNDFMRLEVGKTLLPPGLVFFEDSISEDEVGKAFNWSQTCSRLTHNKTHYTYNVALRCHHVVGELDFGSVTVYSHEVLMTDMKGKETQRNSEVYSIVLECETEKLSPDDDAKDRIMIPEYRLYEHRIGESCASPTCPHGDMCLSSEFIHGYFCQCSSHNCACPDDFYGCRKEKNISSADSLICIRNDQLCDRRFDCPLQDDELCTDMWTPWSMWSTCSETCGQGKQIRQRSCVHTFTQDPSRCSKKCVQENHEGGELDERTCVTGTCASVQCTSTAMLVAIPLEFGMSEDAVDKRMRVKGSAECTPIVNATHVKFAIPLHKCNTSTWIEGNSVYYANEIVYESAKPASDVIVREFGHSYTAKCQYSRRQTVGIKRFEKNPGTELVDVAALSFAEAQGLNDATKESFDMIQHFASGDGEFSYKMDIYSDITYTNPFMRDDYPLQKKLGERLYIGVDFHSQDEDLHVFIEKCWAFASNDVGMYEKDNAYVFIDNGCPLDSTVHFHNDLSHFSDRFSIEAFKFSDPEHWYVYFRCDVILCDVEENDPTCKRTCGKDSAEQNERRKRSAPPSHRSYWHLMQGPIVVLEEHEFGSKASSRMDQRSVGFIEHKLLKFEGDSGVISSVESQETESIWRSPLVSGILIGFVCLMVGAVLGFMLQRRSNREREQRKEQKFHPAQVEISCSEETENPPVHV